MNENGHRLQHKKKIFRRHPCCTKERQGRNTTYMKLRFQKFFSRILPLLLPPRVSAQPPGNITQLKNKKEKLTSIKKEGQDYTPMFRKADEEVAHKMLNMTWYEEG